MGTGPLEEFRTVDSVGRTDVPVLVARDRVTWAPIAQHDNPPIVQHPLEAHAVDAPRVVADAPVVPAPIVEAPNYDNAPLSEYE